MTQQIEIYQNKEVQAQVNIVLENETTIRLIMNMLARS